MCRFRDEETLEILTVQRRALLAFKILYTLLRRSAITSNPHKRTACAPALLAVVARAATRVSLEC
jgi:hypothetical protein